MYVTTLHRSVSNDVSYRGKQYTGSLLRRDGSVRSSAAQLYWQTNRFLPGRRESCRRKDQTVWHYSRPIHNNGVCLPDL